MTRFRGRDDHGHDCDCTGQGACGEHDTRTCGDCQVAAAKNADWDKAFQEELSCDKTHKWDFPVRMGQKCMCGIKVWGKDEK